ncbi:MAG TPA: SCP2 sterol-binding domain-containing protein [Anaerolineales bacterium]|nr:SCP2 sterol-binding domain-containing protein [Anaerolineales bacterium]
MSDGTIQEFLSRMEAAFVAEKATGVDATIQLKLVGAQAAEWYVVIRDNKCNFSEGTAPSAKLTVTADSGDFIKIFTGQMDGMQAFMQGKIKLAGDMNLAMKLMSLFKMQ